MRRLLIGAVALLGFGIASLAACGSAGPSPFAVTYPAATAGVDPVPISLIDQTGLVSAIAVAPASSMGAGAGVEAAPGLTNGLRIGWQGGPCDDRTTLVLNDLGARYELAIHNHPPITAGMTCDDSIVTRVVDITFNRHLDPEQVTLNVQYP